MEKGKALFVRWVSSRGTTEAPEVLTGGLAAPTSSKRKNLREKVWGENEYTGTCTSPEFSRTKFTEIPSASSMLEYSNVDGYRRVDYLYDSDKLGLARYVWSTKRLDDE